MAALKALHPPKSAALPALPSSTPAPIAAIDPDALLRHIRREASKAAAPGTSGWTAEHVLAMWGDERAQRGVCRLVTDILNGNLTDQELLLVNAARLHAIPKSGGKGVRPIAVGEIFYRLAGCVRNATIAANVHSLFPRIQYGVGIKGGAEKALHKIRVAYDKHGKDGVVIRTDFTNAFNARRRDAMFKALFAKTEVSGLWRGLRAAYKRGAPLFVYKDGRLVGVLWSKEGARQGCPNGSFLYSLSVQAFLELVAGRDADRVTVVAYVDDATIIASWRDALDAFRRMQDGAKKENMTLNVEKCYLFWRHREDPPAELVAECAKIGLAIRRDYVEVLGSRIYADDDQDDKKAQQWALDFVKADSTFFDALAHPDMPGQMAHRLLTTCGVPKANYRARTIPPRIFGVAAAEFDRLAAAALLSRLGTTLDKLPPLARMQFWLPQRLSGVAVRSMTLTSAAAYTAAVVDSVGEDVAPHLLRVINSSSGTAARQPPVAATQAADAATAATTGASSSSSTATSSRAQAQRLIDEAAAAAAISTALADVVTQVGQLPRFAQDAVDAMKQVLENGGAPSSDVRVPEGRLVLDACTQLHKLIVQQSDPALQETHLQRALTRDIEQRLYDALTHNSAKDKARLVSLRQEHALDWLRAPASRAEYRIRDPYFGIALRHMLGLPPLAADDDSAADDDRPSHSCRCLLLPVKTRAGDDDADASDDDLNNDSDAEFDDGLPSPPSSPSRRQSTQPTASSPASRSQCAPSQSAASAAQRPRSSDQRSRLQQRADRSAEADHLLVCQSNRNVGGLQRHNHVVNVVAKLADQAGVYKSVEPRHTMDTASERKQARPDVELTGTSHAATLSVDVSIIHPSARTYVARAARQALSAAANRERDKCRKYDPLLAEVRAATGAKITFAPLVFESFGAPGKSVEAVVKWLASEAAATSSMRVDFPTAKAFMAHAYRALSVAVQVGNAKMYLKGLQQNGCAANASVRARSAHIFSGASS
jgi:hypothetical protein